MNRLFALTSLAAVMFAGLMQGAPVIGNASFESPGFSPGGFQYSPVGGPWLYTGAGVAATDPGGFFVPLIPDGNQAAFIQNTGSSISQNVSGFNPGELYTLGFYLAKRTGGCGPCGPALGDLTISVVVDGNVVFSPLNAGTLAPGFHAFTSDPFVATASTLNVSFQASGPGGATGRRSSTR